MGSKSILLLGALLGALVSYLCIHNSQDALITKYQNRQKTPTSSPQPDNNAQAVAQTVLLEKERKEASTQTTALSKDTEKVVSQKEMTAALTSPSFYYATKENGSLTIATNTKNKTLSTLEFIDTICKNKECDKNITFSDTFAPSPWEESAIEVANYLYQHQIEDGSILIEEKKIEITGTFPDQESLESFYKLLTNFSNKGFKINDSTTVLQEEELPEVEIVDITPPSEQEHVKENLTQATTPTNQVKTPSSNATDTTNSEKESGKTTKNKPQTVTVTPVLVKKEQPIENKEQTKQHNLHKTQQEIDTMLKTNPIYFKHSSNQLTLDSKKILDKIIEIVNKYASNINSLKVEGHTDASGSASFNKRLSQKRADAVKEYLQQKGIKVSDITSIGYGEEQPLDAAHPYDRHNRRVEIHIQKENQ